MKYAFNTWCYSSFPSWLPAYPLTSVVERLANIGYDGIEIGCAAPHAWPDYLDPAARQVLREHLATHKLVPSSLLPAPGGGPGANPASMLEQERAWTREHYKAVVDLAADLGCSRVLYIAGWHIAGVTRKDGWRWSLETLKAVAAHAAPKGITICVEPTPADSNLLDTPDHALEMMEESEQSNVKVMFDTFHSLYRNEDPADAVHRMGSALAHVHLADHDRMAPGSGGMDFRPVMEALLETGFDGYLTMEVGFTSRSVHPDSVARHALEHLRALERDLQ